MNQIPNLHKAVRAGCFGRPHAGSKKIALCAFVILGLSVAADAKATITTFDPPGSVRTIAYSINSGAITGYYADSSGVYHGFLRTRWGKFRTFDPAGSITTYAQSINKGLVAGSYEDSAGAFHGFVRAADGTITTFDPANSIYTAANSINNKGTIVGYYRSSIDENVHGYFRTADGTITTFDPTGSYDTTIVSIDNTGRITGNYLTQNSYDTGLLRHTNGIIKSFIPPDGGDTFPLSIDSGAITGYFRGTDDRLHGFLRSP